MAKRSDIFPESARAQPGDWLTNPAYAAYLTELAAGTQPGASELLPGGPVTEPDARQEAAVTRDLVEDAKTEVAEAAALCVDYRSHSVCGSNSTATGFMVTAQTLGILNHIELSQRGPLVRDRAGRYIARATAVHLISEAQRLAFADGHTWMSDSELDPNLATDYRERIVTNAELLGAAAKQVRQRRTLSTPEPHELDGRRHRYTDSQEEGTSQITVRDSAGNIASVTSTLQQNFGSGLTVNGFYLNNSLDNFTPRAQEGIPNARAKGERPRTAMTPTIVFAAGSPTLALGSPGGRKIPSFVLKALIGVIDWGLSVSEAVEMPNFGATNRNSVYLERPDADDAEELGAVAGLLRRWGHSELAVEYSDSGLSAVSIGPETVAAAADPRREGAARRVEAGEAGE